MAVIGVPLAEKAEGMKLRCVQSGTLGKGIFRWRDNGLWVVRLDQVTLFAQALIVFKGRDQH
eukprot:4735636-Amphidinium_carterae.1